MDEEIKDLSKIEMLPVVKLHGSMNWLNSDEEIETKPFKEILENGKTPYIIPPIWAKGSNNATQTLWKYALELISSATRIIIIGFSMPKTDLFFRYLLASGLKNNISLRGIYIVNPNISQIKGSINEIFANNKTKNLIHPIKQKTTEFFAENKFMENIQRSHDKRIQQIH